VKIIAKYRFSDQFGRESIHRQAFVGEDSETILRSIVAMIGIANLVKIRTSRITYTPIEVARLLGLDLPKELVARLG
jgi:hypothetical protein